MFRRAGESMQKILAIHSFAPAAGAERRRITQAAGPGCGKTICKPDTRHLRQPACFPRTGRGALPDDAGRNPGTRLRAHSNDPLQTFQSEGATKAGFL